jgi:hypothetical protein
MQAIPATDRKHAKMRPAAAAMLAPIDALRISLRNLCRSSLTSGP